MVKTACEKSDHIMDKELHYVSVIFIPNEKPNDEAIIYEEMKSARDTSSVLPENKKKAPLLTVLHVVAAGLGVICVILVLVIIYLCMHFSTAMSEQQRDNNNLTAQLQAEKAASERHAEDMSREKDKLMTTIAVIMKEGKLSVTTWCPQKVCKACLDGWVLFQSKCYLFTGSNFTKYWRTWKESHNECRDVKADLVVIESQEEQEFINNHTKYYHDDKHGYWMGLRKKSAADPWMWEDGSNVTVA